jgi:hypothetical protein
MTISSSATPSQVIHNLAQAERNIETLQRNAQAPTYKPYSQSISTGSLQLSIHKGYMQEITNNGSHTLLPPIETGEMLAVVTNGVGGATITTSAFTHVDGAFTTTNGDKFLVRVTVFGTVSYANITALQ